MTGALTDANLRSLHDLQEGDEYSAGSSLPLSDIQDQSQFKDEPHSVVSSSKRSLLNESSAGHHQGLTARRKDDLYGSEGDLLWKALVISLLTMIGTAAGFVYLYGLIQGDLDTTGKFKEYANLLDNRSPDQVKEINGGMATWSVHGSSYATDHANVWPFHHFSHFELLTHQTKALVQNLEPEKDTNVQWVATAPLVSDDIRSAWEVYSIQQLHKEGGTKPQKVRTLTAINDRNLQSQFPAHLQIHSYDQATRKVVAEEEGAGPYAPIFQMSHSDRSRWNISADAEAASTSILFNFNLLSIPAFVRAFSLVQHTGEAVMSEPIILEDNFYGSIVLNNEGDAGVGEPYSILVNPILSGSTTDAHVVGALVGLVPYKAFFDDIVPMDAKGMSLVVRPGASCDIGLNAFTFTFDSSKVSFKGEGDVHDTSSDFHETQLGWEPFVKHRHPHGEDDMVGSEELLKDYYSSVSGDENTRYCNYELYVYPSDVFYNTFRSNGPALFAAFLVGIFLFVYIILNLYGYIVKRKDLLAFTAAQRSAAIVDMFFPAEIKERLLEEQDDVGEEFEDEGAFMAEGAEKRMVPTQGFDPARFLDDKPIASLFPETTIIFADIAGFTAWSSEREPSQVFILLETIYGEFDKIAMRRKVFKVETIGDCYLAVTGIPDRQEDHAVIMSQFAREAMSKMYKVTAALELTLGPDTTDLTMRMGLHSGPTTAGVLRGRKSHFQLFGDTVNTAARMESTGMREKIQVSQETADLLRKSGRSHWLKARDNGVDVKGKGNLPTFWLLPRTPPRSGSVPSNASVTTRSSVTDRSVSEHSDEADEDLSKMLLPLKPKSSKQEAKELTDKSKRLVQWNVALLVQLLAKVAGGRKSQNVEDPGKLEMLEQQFVEGTSILAEVQETIAVSKAASKVSGAGLRRQSEIKTKRNGMAGIDPIVPDEVVSQLTDYVSKVAALHPDNPFHNFEHASHVTMSTSKLLSRIVNVDEAAAKSTSTFDAGEVSLTMANQKRHAHNTSYGITSDPLTQFSVVFAALIHDVDHPGVSNAILMSEAPEIGNKYKNKSVAEQKSVDIAFTLLMKPQYEGLRHYIYTNEKELMQFRQLIVNSVIATDIFDKEHGQFRKARWAKAFEEDGEAISGDTSPITSLDRKATIVIEHLIQASDVSHTMQHWHVYQKWNGRLFEEMFKAFKEGRSTANPALSWYKGEIWFFDNYVIPLAKKLETCGVFGVSSDEFLNYAEENRKEWAQKGETIVAEMVAKMEPIEEL